MTETAATPTTVAVVGLGYFSQFHLRSWADNPDANLIAACDLNAQALQTVTSAYSLPGYTAAAQMLAQHNPDVVDIVAPPVAHAELIEQMLRPGRLILCQKPFCTSIEQAQQLAARASAHQTTIVIHENFRFQPWHRALKQFLDSDAMGQIFQCRFALRPGDGRGVDAYLDRQPFFQTMPRLLIHETGVHFIDLFRWLLGDVESVYADLRRLNPVIAGEDAGLLVMEHAGGAVSVFDGNRLSDHVADNPRLTMGDLWLEGEQGVVRLDGYGKLHFRRHGSTTAQPLPVSLAVDENAFGGGCVDYLNRSALDAYRTHGQYENAIASYMQVMQISDAAYRSDSTGSKVFL